ncbi:MAG TPA: DUF1043 family protein [Pseudomonadales bacterium]|nr:DUF1043 family protein [Pseudomonadales bacterium]
MYELNELILAAIASLILGGVAGLVFGNSKNTANKKNKDLEKSLAESQEELRGYQKQVNEHFQKTAELVRELNESYRGVHQHLAQGAHQLAQMNPSAYLSLIGGRSEDELTEEELAHIRQPLDYSPKKSPDEKGMLREDFGLEKVKPQSDDDDDDLSEYGETPIAPPKF